MTPEQLAAPGTEHAHQVALFCWLATMLPRYPEVKWIYAIPNGGKRDPITANKLKSEGVKSNSNGVPDGADACPHGFLIRNVPFCG